MRSLAVNRALGKPTDFWHLNLPAETRAYVQRVIENSVVYDSMRGNPPQQSAMHVSRYLGKSGPG